MEGIDQTKDIASCRWPAPRNRYSNESLSTTIAAQLISRFVLFSACAGGTIQKMEISLARPPGCLAVAGWRDIQMNRLAARPRVQPRVAPFHAGPCSTSRLAVASVQDISIQRTELHILLHINCLSVDSSSHQGRWGSGIALLLAAPTIGRTARDAIRYRTPTDIFNFNVEMISLFNFIMQCNVMKSFLEQYSTPDETKIKYKCHLQNSDRNMFSTFFAIKSIISS